MAKKLVALLLVLMLTMGGSVLATAEAASTDTATQTDSIFPLKDEITLTAFVLGMPGGVDYTNNYVTQWIKEKTNINLQFVAAVSGDDGKTKLNMMLYSGEKLPDIFISTGWSKAECQSYGKQGLILPLNDYLKDAKVWNDLNVECPARQGDLTMTDGNIYSYGNVGECFHCTHQARMWIYQPWVDSLNGGVLPTTTDELYAFLNKVKTMDPNGNGKADEIPVSGYLDGWATDPFVFLSNAFVQNNNFISNTNPVVAGGFVVDNGKIKYNLLSDQYREALRYMNKLYSEGLLDSQTYTQTSDQCNATLENDPHLVALMGGGAMPENKNMWVRKEGDWQDWTLLPPLKGPDGVQYAYTGLNTYYNNCCGVVSADCQYPEIAVQLFDLLASPEGTNVQSYGIEGIQWRWTTEGSNLVGGTPVYEKLTPEHTLADGTIDFSAYGYTCKSSTWDSDASIGGRTSKGREEEGITGDPKMYSESILQAAAIVYDPYSYKLDTIVPNMPYTDEQSKKISEYAVSVGAYANSATIRFITGDMSIDNDWATYLSEMDKMDVNGYIATMQEAYDSYAASLKK